MAKIRQLKPSQSQSKMPLERCISRESNLAMRFYTTATEMRVGDMSDLPCRLNWSMQHRRGALPEADILTCAVASGPKCPRCTAMCIGQHD
jgi:hypothetical protein